MPSTCDAPSHVPRSASNGGSSSLSIHASGSGGLLLNPGNGTFQLEIQQRLWGLQAHLDEAKPLGLLETVAGVNNLLVLFDPLLMTQDTLWELVLSLWDGIQPKAITGQEHLIPVDYGGEYGPDLTEACKHLHLSIDDLVSMHSTHTYTVACIGSTPGFAYLVGLPAQLAIPRRKTPRTHAPRGSVMIGGSQTGIQPVTAPSGWNILGRSDTSLFDPNAEKPCLLTPGDQVRFTISSLTL